MDMKYATAQPDTALYGGLCGANKVAVNIIRVYSCHILWQLLGKRVVQYMSWTAVVSSLVL